MQLIYVFSPQPEHFTLAVNERGTTFEERIEIDEKEETALFRVPAHNQVDGAEILNDFRLVSFSSTLHTTDGWTDKMNERPNSVVGAVLLVFNSSKYIILS